METLVLVIHLLLALSLVGVILVQRSEGGGLGIGGGGSMGGMMSARGTANLLTRTTAILAGCFMFTSVVLAVMAGHHSAPTSVIETIPASQPQPAAPTAPVEAPAAPTAPAPTTSAPTPPAPAAPAPPVAP